AHLVNGDAVRYLADHCSRWNTLLVHFSSDFVFDGTKRSPYEIDDEIGPISVYGESKLAGELAASRSDKHLIVRTSWVFGPQGSNFVEAITGQIEKGRDQLRVVDDQRGRPTYVPHLVEATMQLIELAKDREDARGVVHYADVPFCSWYEFAVAIVGELETRGQAVDVRIEPITTDEMPRPAQRPAYSVLSTSRYEELTGTTPRLWQLGLIDYFARREGLAGSP
ncbi:MAG: sugar nucleotide-binding protein, partial [Thermoanaerobaculia bacterium]|nr:sugar nucleotide-binding protein [Thermoanaerobaculia bacterium]